MSKTKQHLRGIRIKIAILESGLSQRRLAKIMDMPLSTLNMKVLNERKFTESEMRKLSTILCKPLESLFPDIEDNESGQITQEQSRLATG